MHHDAYTIYNKLCDQINILHIYLAVAILSRWNLATVVTPQLASLLLLINMIGIYLLE